MTTIDFLTLAMTLAVGGVLGAFFFGGLWWTVQKGTVSRHPALWFLGSLVVRTTVVLVGFYYVSGRHWERMLACLLGFILARCVVTRLVGRPDDRHPSPIKEADHAA